MQLGDLLLALADVRYAISHEVPRQIDILDLRPDVEGDLGLEAVDGPLVGRVHLVELVRVEVLLVRQDLQDLLLGRLLRLLLAQELHFFIFLQSQIASIPSLSSHNLIFSFTTASWAGSCTLQPGAFRI